VPWSYLVVDEGHRLKNAACKLNAELRAYSTQHRLLLTGGLCALVSTPCLHPR
jgi:SNF2 family DNA or RNA helicase